MADATVEGGEHEPNRHSGTVDSPIQAGNDVKREENVEETKLSEPLHTDNEVNSEKKDEKLPIEDKAVQAERSAETNGAEEPKTADESAKSRTVKKENGEPTAHADKNGKRKAGDRNDRPTRPYEHSYRKNIKFDPSSLAVSSDPDEIRRQVEFYFSDSNLPMDKFLLEKVGGTSNLPVEIKLLHSFKRMRHFQPYEAVVAALKDSQVLEVTEDETVRRKVPLEKDALGASVTEGQKKVEDKTLSRSIYAKGFDEETPTTQFEIEAFFVPYGPINAIRLRRTVTGMFKTSAFVEFADDATQAAFLALDPKPKWKGKDLLIKGKKEYVEGKAADIAAGRIPSRQHWIDKNKIAGASDWKKRREEDQKRGFRDERNQDGGLGKGRGGGIGRGRGGRGGGRGGRDHRNNTRDPHKVPVIATSTAESAGEIKRESPKSDETKHLSAEAKPEALPPTTIGHIKSEKLQDDNNTTHSASAPMDVDAASKKRAREADGEEAASGESARKKVDTKTEG